MSDLQYRASRILSKLGSSPVVWNEKRDVVHITFEKETYSNLLKLLVDIEKEDDEPEYRRVRIV